ncbi:hypothetical protein FF011L_21250 [Roseimaritima multifibrata]|uniref:Uncharacterized protein n=1 Tax=Roseimaritima multifibrata TaxID=1930274 RepID=A0A517MEP5_9BACT|nr:hypothetical protein [Roseimaritima multifibrata]QDS93362.1 hypothetical protein FF011L_21250 [Roseimaritima multifibrata]
MIEPFKTLTRLRISRTIRGGSRIVARFCESKTAHPQPFRSAIAATCMVAISLSLFSCGLVGNVASAADSLERKAEWQMPDSELAVAALRDALQQQNTSDQAIEQAAAAFQAQLEQPQTDRLDAFVDAAAGVVPTIAEIIDASLNGDLDPTDKRFDKLSAVLRKVVASYIGRDLVRERLFDEALPLLADIEFQTFVDPATLLFYRAACNHALLNKEETLKDLRRLLDNDAECPIRYARTAKLMLVDMKPLKPDSLDEISRLMSDVERRLELGRSDDKVQEQEQAIIDKLSKLIDKMEEQQKQQQQQQQQGGGSSSGGQAEGQGQPMQDSQAAGGGGAGDVDKRDLGKRSEWGKMPPADREQALQQIGQDLPTHYREAIEAYFRKMATDK